MERKFFPHHKIDLTHHSVAAIVFACYDPRFRQALQDFLRARFGNDPVDIVTLAGGARSLAHPDDISHRGSLEQIRVSQEKHHAPLIVPIIHAYCARYADPRLDSPDQGFQFAKGEFEAVEKHVRGAGINLPMECYFMTATGTQQVNVF